MAENEVASQYKLWTDCWLVCYRYKVLALMGISVDDDTTCVVTTPTGLSYCIQFWWSDDTLLVPVAHWAQIKWKQLDIGHCQRLHKSYAYQPALFKADNNWWNVVWVWILFSHVQADADTCHCSLQSHMHQNRNDMYYVLLRIELWWLKSLG